MFSIIHYFLNILAIFVTLLSVFYLLIFSYKYWKFCNTDSEKKDYVDEWVEWVKHNCMSDDKIDFIKLAEELTQQRREVKIFETDYTLIPHCSAYVHEDKSWFEYVVIPNWEIWIDKTHSYAHEFGHICLEHIYVEDRDVIQHEVEAEYFATHLTGYPLIFVYLYLLLVLPISWVRIVFFMGRYYFNKYVLGKVPDYDKYLGDKWFSDLKMYKDHIFKFFSNLKQKLKRGTDGQSSD